MNDNRRYHILIEQQIDIFVDVCKEIITKKNLSKQVWVIKDEDMSVVGIGDPDKLIYKKDFGFALYYEMIIGRLSEAVDEFRFKLDHFIKLANTTDRFEAFKNDQKQDNKKDSESEINS